MGQTDSGQLLLLIKDSELQMWRHGGVRTLLYTRHLASLQWAVWCVHELFSVQVVVYRYSHE